MFVSACVFMWLYLLWGAMIVNMWSYDSDLVNMWMNVKTA